MPWVYSQTTGELADPNGALAGRGYSGHGDGLNATEFQNVPDVGPIPEGTWQIVASMDTDTHGPFVLVLEPLNGTETFGRSGFLIHGDEIEHPGQHLASHGCIVLARSMREAIWASTDHTLEVVS